MDLAPHLNPPYFDFTGLSGKSRLLVTITGFSETTSNAIGGVGGCPTMPFVVCEGRWYNAKRADLLLGLLVVPGMECLPVFKPKPQDTYSPPFLARSHSHAQHNTLHYFARWAHPPGPDTQTTGRRRRQCGLQRGHPLRTTRGPRRIKDNYVM